ncbi:pyruvate dehydrogenase phosphatase, partial [Lecanoromycetidae sp. Uapishka_2]
MAAILVTGTAMALTYYKLYVEEPAPLCFPGISDEERGHVDIERRYSTPVVPLTSSQASEILRWEQSSHTIGGASGVQRFDTVRVASNSPVEDELVSASGNEDGAVKWMMWGVFDGHGGWETSAALHDQLTKYILRELLAASSNRSITELASEDTDKAIFEAFKSLEHDIMEAGIVAVYNATDYSDGLSRTRPTQAGSCALVSYYNCETEILKVACTGDSRAVLGYRDPDGHLRAIPYSFDQTGKNKDEVARLQAAHPNEPNMFDEDGRLMGLMPTRAFGDSYGKWSRPLQERVRSRFNGQSYPQHSLTPPYITAEPVITTWKINKDCGSFLIMASDGLWDNLTNEQAVDLVGLWLETHKPSAPIAPADLAQAPTSLVPEQGQSSVGSEEENRNYAWTKQAKEANFVVKDDNAATHLVRNALGGKDEDMLRGLLTVSSPVSRKMRDDISVQVIFFGRDFSTIQNN